VSGIVNLLDAGDEDTRSLEPIDLGQRASAKPNCPTAALRSTWRARNSYESVDASHCSFAALAHNSRGAAQHFRFGHRQKSSTTPGESPVKDDACGSANRLQRPQ
jgi:hypothetical protein